MLHRAASNEGAKVTGPLSGNGADPSAVDFSGTASSHLAAARNCSHSARKSSSAGFVRDSGAAPESASGVPTRGDRPNSETTGGCRAGLDIGDDRSEWMLCLEFQKLLARPFQQDWDTSVSKLLVARATTPSLGGSRRPASAHGVDLNFEPREGRVYFDFKALWSDVDGAGQAGLNGAAN